MKILWAYKKYLDVAMDKATWIEMMKCLQANNHDVKFVTNYKDKKLDFGLGKNIKYLLTVKRKFLNHITYCISLFFFLKYGIP